VTQRELASAVGVGEEAIVPDAMKAVRQGVQQEAANELVALKRHDLCFAAMAIILSAERDRGVGHAEEAGVGDIYAMGVSAEIGQHLLWAAEGRLGIDHPVDAAKLAEPAGEEGRFREVGEITEEAEVASRKGGT